MTTPIETNVQRKVEQHERAKQAVATIMMLAERFPACFAVLETRRRPLKVGIHEDILAAIAIAPEDLRSALGRYVSSDGYCRSCKAGAARIGLDGQAVGVVTESEAQWAQMKLAARAAKLKAKREARVKAERAERTAERAAKKAAAPLPPSPVETKRLSIEGLREAARQRLAEQPSVLAHIIR